MNYQALLISKLENVLAEIHYLQHRRYSYVSPKNALVLLEKYFTEQKKLISGYSRGDALKELCVQAQNDIDSYMAIIGLIANSANVRNLFEMHEPLWRIACRVLEPDKVPSLTNINLIISSEWMLSPFVFAGLHFTPVLKDYILIGLPASESSNPLLVPLAGHELGHIVWRKFGLRRELQPTVQKIVSELLQAKNNGNPLKLLDSPLYAETCALALKQAEETFCDFFGLRLFRQSYIYAFFYLLFPWREAYTEEQYSYPPIGVRLETFKSAVQEFNIEFPPEVQYETCVHSCNTDQCRYLCRVRKEITALLITRANEIITPNKKGLNDLAGNEDEVARIANKLKKIVPATKIQSLADIINAGWKVYFDKQKGNIDDARFSNATLMDLVAKNFEILAIEQRINSKSR